MLEIIYRRGRSSASSYTIRKAFRPKTYFSSVRASDALAKLLKQNSLQDSTAETDSEYLSCRSEQIRDPCGDRQITFGDSRNHGLSFQW